MRPGPGGLDLEDLAARGDTPFFVYDLDAARAQVERLRRAVAGPAPVRVHYAVKANPCPELLAALRGAVDGLDIASLGELGAALAAGFPAGRLGLAGPGKSDALLAAALRAEVGAISVESVAELERLARCHAAAGLSRPARVLLRLDPPEAIAAFAVRMGGVPGPFGLEVAEVPAALAVLAAHPARLHLAGIHVHAGSQCVGAGALARHVASVLDLAEAVHRAAGRPLEIIDAGGGLGAPRDGASLDVDAFGRKAQQAFARYARAMGGDPVLVLEPGRYLVAEAGLYAARVVARKATRGRTFVILDGGTHHLLPRTSHHAFGGPRRVENVTRPGAPLERVTLVGPLCTPLDAVVPEADLPRAEPGDLVVLPDSGAYGLTASPALFLGHPLPAEWVVEGGAARRARPLAALRPPG